MKKIVLIILLFYSYLASSQVKIGQTEGKTIYFLNYLLRGNQNVEVKKKYNNGELQEIIVLRKRQLYYYLEVKTDTKERYLFKDKRLSHIITEFPELSIEYIDSKLNDRYHKYKVDNYYFDKDYKHFRTVLLLNKIACITYMQTGYNNHLDDELKVKINRHKKYLKQEKIIAKNRRDIELKQQQIFSYKNEAFNLKNYNFNYVKELEEEITNVLIEDSKKQLKTVIKNLEQKEVNYYYTVKFYSKSDSDVVNKKIVENNSEMIYDPLSIDNIDVVLPKISKELDGKDYLLNRYIDIPIYYYLKVGKLEVRIKRNKLIDILTQSNLNKKQLSYIRQKLHSNTKGKYIVYYQFGVINEQSADFVRILK